MQNLWDDREAAACANDPVKLRVYTSRLLGREPALVLHGGGNTSVKAERKNLFGDTESVIYVKGSGWDLATIEAPGFAPVKMELLLRMARLPKLSDSDMVREQKAAMTDPGAPNPSVEAILHALIPHTYVDHTHSDAVVAVSNTPDGEANIRKIYGERVLVVPYVMPGFILARKVYEMTRDVDWSRYEGMVLLHHGIFSFAEDAKTSYDRMIRLVTEAEEFLKAKKAFESRATGPAAKESLRGLAELRRAVARATGVPLVAKLDGSPEACGFAGLKNIAEVSGRGPLTPDHIIHTKRTPLLFRGDAARDVEAYAADYRAYFTRNIERARTARSSVNDGKLTCLDPAPRWAVWPEHGVVAFGPSAKRADVVADISRHTMKAVQWAEALGGWRALPEEDLFEVEYWELEQAKLKKGGSGSSPALQGKIALVTGAASGIGRACAEQLRAQGAAVAALDISPSITGLFKGADALGIVCDLTDSAAVDAAIASVVRCFGGLDIVVLNAGVFPPSKPIAELDDPSWKKSLEINLTSHHYVLRASIPYLVLGLDAAVVVVASKNVPAPGPGAAAYSAAKAGLTQLARVAALELGPQGVRVNMLHPHAVLDTAIWTPEVLESRARSYGMSVEQYKTNNVLRVEVVSKDVAALACAMAGPLFSKTTGAQVAVDGGNDRVI